MAFRQQAKSGPYFYASWNDFSDFSKCYLLMSKDASHVVVHLQRLKMRYLSPPLLMFLWENKNG